MKNGFWRRMRPVGVAMGLGAAIGAGWFANTCWMAHCSLMTEPASAPARLNEARGSEPAPFDEAETAEQSVQSARNEDVNPIRVDGPAAAAVGGAADGPHDELLELVTSESRLVTTHLVTTIAELRRDLDERAARIRKLSEALGEAQAALDHQEVWRAQAASERTPPVRDAPLDARIVDANPELGLVVINQGARQGVRYGLPLTVLRDRRQVARIRVVDVRERVAGAAVEETARGDHPQPGDRAVLIRPAGP